LNDCFPLPDKTSAGLIDISIVDCIFSSSKTAVSVTDDAAAAAAAGGGGGGGGGG
jgi:hypothetical protein